MILPPRKEHICEIGESKPEPRLSQDDCSQFYYNCQMEEGRAIWKYTKCSDGNVFSPNITQYDQSNLNLKGLALGIPTHTIIFSLESQIVGPSIVLFLQS